MTASKTPIGEVFEKLAQSTGVRFVIDESTYQSLPFDKKTTFTLSIKGRSLRNALTPLLAPRRCSGPSRTAWCESCPPSRSTACAAAQTREELLCLGRICWDQDQAGKGKLTASTKTDTAGQLADLTAQLRKITEDEALEIVFRVPDEKVGEAVAHGQKALPASGGEFLDALTQGQGWTWYLDGGRLIVLDSRKQVERQLGRQFTLKYEGMSISDVLTDLAHKARVQLEMEPGVLAALPADTRNNFSLRMNTATVAEALEVISGGTGLAFTRTADGLRVEMGKQPSGPPGSTTRSSRPTLIIRKTITLPDGSTVDLMIRGDDLPDDVRAYLEAERGEIHREPAGEDAQDTDHRPDRGNGADHPAGVTHPREDRDGFVALESISDCGFRISD